MSANPKEEGLTPDQNVSPDTTENSNIIVSESEARGNNNSQIMSAHGFTVHAGVEYLFQRGISVEQAQAVGIKFITHAEANDYLHTPRNKRSFSAKRDALWFPFWCADGTQHPYHGHAIFFNANKKPFKLNTEKTPQYPNEISCLPLQKGHTYINLPEGATVFWCESIAKAVIPNQHFGFAAIGLNGVNGYSRGNGALCREATKLAQNLVHVYISDSLNKANRKSMQAVIGARSRWYVSMLKQYPQSEFYYIELPPPPADWPKDDWGLDDFRKVNGLEATRKLLDESNRRQFKQTSEVEVWLDYFNSKFVYIRQLSKVYDIDENQLLLKAQFFDNYAPFRFGKKGDDNSGQVAAAWFNWIDRFEVSGLAFRPGEDLICGNSLNLWRGFDVKPNYSDEAQAQVKEFWLDTLYEIFGDDARYLIELCAHLVQHPDRRISKHLFLGGPPGVGKNFAIEPLCMILKTHFQPFTLENFINHFNAAHNNCRLGVLNETGDPDQIKPVVMTAVGEVLKKNADQNEKVMQLEGKNKDIGTPVDRLQFNVTISNYGPPFRIDPDDRRAVCLRANKRMAIASANNEGTKDLDYWGKRWHWLNYEDGAAGVMGFLLKYDLAKADIEGPAPLTSYKKLLIGQRKTSAKSFISDFGRKPLEYLAEALGWVDEDKPEAEKAEAITKWLKPYELTPDTESNQYVFEATHVSRCYSILIERVDNHKALATSIGKWAADMWEVESQQLSGRGVGGARIYGIKDGKIVHADILGLGKSKTDKLACAARLGGALVDAETLTLGGKY